METTTTNNPAKQDEVSSELLGRETLTRLMPQLLALRPDELMQITADVRSAVATILGALPKIRTYREAIQKNIPGFEIGALEVLEDAAVALHQADNDYLAAAGPSDEFDEWIAEAGHLRELLLADANNLALRGLVNGSQLDELKGANGHKNLATDLGVLASLLRSSWDRIQGKTAVQAEELARAEKLSLHIVRNVGLRAQSAPIVAEATNIRVRSFTFALRSYDKLRQAISYLRWEEGDLDKIAPSVFANRGSRRKQPEPTPDPIPTVGTLPSNAGSTTSAGSGASGTAPKAADAPGSEPFVDH
jgi:hypothetical protein